MRGPVARKRLAKRRIDSSATTWEGSRRRQLERWSRLSLDEILDWLEATAEIAKKSRGRAAKRARR